MKAIKRQFSILWNSQMYGMLLILGTSLAGAVLLQIIMMETDKGAEPYIALGTVLGCIAAALYSFITAALIATYFNVEVSMGCTRKEFFLSYFAVCVVGNIFSVILLSAICLAENVIYNQIFSVQGRKVDLLPYLLKYGVPAAVTLAIAGIMCGILVMRLGKKAFWTLWGLWMFGSIGIPRIGEAAKKAPDSVFGVIGNAVLEVFYRIPGNAWFVGAVVLCAFGFAVSFYFIRRQQVA